MTVKRLTVLICTLRMGAEIIPLGPSPQVRVQRFPDAPKLPTENESFAASDGATWKRLEKGTARDERVFQAKRYLPCDSVRGYSELNQGRVRVHTSCGDSEIWFEPMTLAQKANH